MKILYSILAALALAGAAGAQTPVNDVLRWTNATENTDSTPLTDLKSVLVQWGSVSGGPYAAGSKTVTDTSAAPITSTTITRPGTGVGTVCYVASSVNSTGAVSVHSTESCRTVTAQPKTPKAPTGLTASGQ